MNGLIFVAFALFMATRLKKQEVRAVVPIQAKDTVTVYPNLDEVFEPNAQITPKPEAVTAPPQPATTPPIIPVIAVVPAPADVPKPYAGPYYDEQSLDVVLSKLNDAYLDYEGKLVDYLNNPIPPSDHAQDDITTLTKEAVKIREAIIAEALSSNPWNDLSEKLARATQADVDKYASKRDYAAQMVRDVESGNAPAGRYNLFNYYRSWLASLRQNTAKADMFAEVLRRK